MNFAFDGIVHVLERMWDIDNVKHMYTDSIEYLRKQCPMNLKFHCDERALWMGDLEGMRFVVPTEEPATCLFCLARSGT